MPSADTLIPEDPPYFEDLLKAANNETLQVQLSATSPRLWLRHALAFSACT